MTSPLPYPDNLTTDAEKLAWLEQWAVLVSDIMDATADWLAGLPKQIDAHLTEKFGDRLGEL